MTYNGTDFYCDMVFSGLVSVQVMAETDEVLAFHHTRPSFPVHVVMVPKRHIPSLVDLGEGDEALLAAVMTVVREVAAQITAVHGKCRVLTNLGQYQNSKLLHFQTYVDGPRPNPATHNS
jgi:histidine triad (HIT) family protein